MNERYNEQDPAPQYDPEAARIRRALRAQKARRRKKMRSRRLFLLGMALILLFVLVPNLWGRAERLLYPRKYEALVERWADTYDLDPLLVDAFIRTESGFDPQATSTVDARGLMQMTEETFIWLRSKIAPDEGLLFANLYDPETSIRFGCYYLHLCMERYNGDVATAAAAYHSGWGTVDALLQMEEHRRRRDPAGLPLQPDEPLRKKDHFLLCGISAHLCRKLRGDKKNERKTYRKAGCRTAAL